MYSLPNSLVILTFCKFRNILIGLFHLWRRGWGGGRHTSRRRFTPISHRIWPKLLAHMFSRLFCSVGSHGCPHLTFFFFEEPFGLRQWAPRSVGPYGVGRLPTPLMHAPVGHAYGHPKGVPIIGRDSFSFCRSSALRAPGSNGAP